MSLPAFDAAGHQSPLTEGQAGGHQGETPAAGQEGGHQGQSMAGTEEGGHEGPDQTGEPTQSMDHGGEQTGNPNAFLDRVLIGRFTTATGYVGLGLIAITLLIGPVNLLLRRRTPISNYLTRDVGTWATIVSVVHVIAGFFVHGASSSIGERILLYFFAPDGALLLNSFGLGNWTGLIATVIVVGLLSISNDFALRKLKAKRWKWLQRLNYVLFVLVIAHAIYYGALLRAASISTILLGVIVSAVLAGQAIGIWLWRRKHALISKAVSLP